MYHSTETLRRVKEQRAQAVARKLTQRAKRRKREAAPDPDISLDDPIIGPAAFALAMNCSRATFYRRLAAGTIPRPKLFEHSRLLGWRRSEAEETIREFFRQRQSIAAQQPRNGNGQFGRKL